MLRSALEGFTQTLTRDPVTHLAAADIEAPQMLNLLKALRQGPLFRVRVGRKVGTTMRAKKADHSVMVNWAERANRASATSDRIRTSRRPTSARASAGDRTVNTPISPSRKTRSSPLCGPDMNAPSTRRFRPCSQWNNSRSI